MIRLAETRPLPSWTASLASGDTETLIRVGATPRSYVDAVITPYRHDIQTAVGSDHAHRLRRMACGGTEKPLDGLRPLMRWNSPVLEVAYVKDRDLYLNGRGLRLVPSYFCGALPVSLADPELPPTLVYPIAAEHHWAHAMSPGTEALGSLLGRTRAAVLRTIRTGMTTTELARRLTMSLASASRHTAVLRNAGLLSSHRYGPAVLHTRTRLGESLLSTAETPREFVDRTN